MRIAQIFPFFLPKNHFASPELLKQFAQAFASFALALSGQRHFFSPVASKITIGIFVFVRSA